ncbi:MAG: sigma-70 family RNA polymerase sigma factor [Planctomycetota bacterium]
MPDEPAHFACQWLRDYGDRLFSYAAARTGGDASIAEDLVQETLLAAMKAYSSFKGDSAVETWLVGILRRKIIDRYRRAEREGKRRVSGDSGVDAAIFDAHGSLLDVTNWGPDAAQRLESEEFRQVFDRCLADLKPPLAQAFTLCVMDGISTEEACSLLGITPTNLSVRLHRARVTLRKLLQARWFEPQ